jgi:hypothetical protein
MDRTSSPGPSSAWVVVLDAPAATGIASTPGRPPRGDPGEDGTMAPGRGIGLAAVRSRFGGGSCSRRWRALPHKLITAAARWGRWSPSSPDARAESAIARSRRVVKPEPERGLHPCESASRRWTRRRRRPDPGDQPALDDRALIDAPPIPRDRSSSPCTRSRPQICPAGPCRSRPVTRPAAIAASARHRGNPDSFHGTDRSVIGCGMH